MRHLGTLTRSAHGFGGGGHGDLIEHRTGNLVRLAAVGVDAGANLDFAHHDVETVADQGEDGVDGFGGGRRCLRQRWHRDKKQTDRQWLAGNGS